MASPYYPDEATFTDYLRWGVIEEAPESADSADEDGYNPDYIRDLQWDIDHDF